MMTRHAVAVVLAGGLLSACANDGSNPVSPDWSVVASAGPAGVAVVDVTNVVLRADAVSPRPGALGYAWSLGDGTSAGGPIVSHVYSAQGVFEAKVTVTDASGDSRTAAVAVTVRSLSGHWTPLQNGVAGLDAVIVQRGSAISGQSANDCCTHTYSGQVSDPRAVVLAFRFSGCRNETRTFTGTVSDDLNSITLTGSNCNVPVTSYSFRR